MPNEMLQETEHTVQSHAGVRGDFHELVSSAVALGGHIRVENRRTNYISLVLVSTLAFQFTAAGMYVSANSIPFNGMIFWALTTLCPLIFIGLFILKFDTSKSPIVLRLAFKLLQVGEPRSVRHKQQIFLKMTALIWETGPVLVEQGHISELKWQSIQLEISQFTI